MSKPLNGAAEWCSCRRRRMTAALKWLKISYEKSLLWKKEGEFVRRVSFIVEDEVVLI
jgi:hypothetical protein